MKRIFTFLLIFLGLNMAHAQLSAEDMVFWVGDGDQEAYIIVDFKDGTADSSFGWGVRFNEGDGLTMAGALNLIGQADVGFSLDTSYNGTYLDGITYNHHEGYDLEPESWSLWSGDTVDAFGMQGGGIGQTLSDGKWYGASYVYYNPGPVAPTFKYAAYSPEWFTMDEVEYWIGEGENEAAVTIDFVSDADEEIVTYVWGVKFDGTITGDQALELIADADEDLEVSISATGELELINYKGLGREVDTSNSWKTFIGNSMSDYQPTLLEEEIAPNKLFGVSFGDENVRRPFIPTPAEESDTSDEEPDTPNLGSDDIVFWVGEGDKEAYVLIDFRDDTEDISFGWGVRFNEEDDSTMGDILDMIADADNGFSTEKTAFLSDIIYNHHEGIGGQPDYWSTWSGDAADALGMQGGVSEDLSEGRWYGFSYGFMPPIAPTFKYAAYSPEWFTMDEVEYWVGEGENEAAVTIDFVADENEEVVTYVWGVKFTDALTGVEALEMLATVDEDLEVSLSESDELESITYKGMSREVDENNTWKAFIGNSMSDYQPTLLEETITPNKLFGVSFGDQNVRRPFIPTAVEDPFLSVTDIANPSNVKLWPNPASHTLHIESESAIENIRIFNMLGVEVLQTTSNTVNVSTFSSGVYLVEITGAANIKIQRFIKR